LASPNVSVNVASPVRWKELAASRPVRPTDQSAPCDYGCRRIEAHRYLIIGGFKQP